MAASIVSGVTNLRVSSVLNRDVKQFGKKHLVDAQDDTCWNSDQGSPQWIHVELGTPTRLAELHLQFQGGFAGRDCWVEGSRSPSDDHREIVKFYPEDINSLQIFNIPGDDEMSSLRIVFSNSTDFFGRITVYKLDIIGNPG